MAILVEISFSMTRVKHYKETSNSDVQCVDLNLIEDEGGPNWEWHYINDE